MQQYSIKTLLATYKAAKTGMSIRINDWTNPVLTSKEWLKWFRECLDKKISSHLPQHDDKRYLDYKLDARVINEYYGKRIVHPGRNVLRVRKLQIKYPHINNYNHNEF